MKAEEKIRKLKEKNFREWNKTRQKVNDELSEKQPMLCMCGELATASHERNCRKFNKLVNKETMKRLEHLIRA